MNPSNEPQKSPGDPASSTPNRGSREEQETLGAFAEAKQKIKAVAQDTTRQVKSAARETASQAQRAVNERKETVASRVDRYGAAVHESAESLEGEDPNLAWLSHRAADRLQSVADYVRRSDFPALRRDAEGLARRHPALFFGGLFVAGLVLGNVVKASGQSQRSSSREDRDNREDESEENLPRGENAPQEDATRSSAQAEEV